MLHIAIVEDDPSYVRQLQDYLGRYSRESGEPIEVAVYTDGDEIVEGYRAQFDLILLDVEMPFLDGMTAAEEIRRRDSEVVIIFITNMAQYAIRGYAVDALDYVLKPVPYFAFTQQLQKAVNRLQKRQRTFLTVAVEGGLRRIAVETIYYLESDGHNVRLYAEDGMLLCAGSLKSFEEKLAGKPFARCNSGYLVNLAQVSAVQQNTVQVGPYELQISRPRKKSFLEALTDYIGGGVK